MVRRASIARMTQSRFISCTTTNGSHCVHSWTRGQSAASWRNWPRTTCRKAPTNAAFVVPRPTHDLLKVREWIDANTAILYAYSQWFVGGDQGDLEANFLFTLKFDADGNWKIVKTHQMSDKEIEKKDAGEDVSGSGQTTEQEGLSADASFRDADRHLNEVYNALRARDRKSTRLNSSHR